MNIIYWGEEMLQDNIYNSGEWEENYEIKQKTQALQLERSRLKTDRAIYDEIGNNEAVDNATQRIRKINSTIKELNK